MLVERARARDLEADEVVQALGRAQRLDLRLGDAEEVQVLGGDVDVVAGGVDGHVLPEVRELQRRRDLVGEAYQLGLAIAEQGQQQAAHRVGRARRVAAQRLEGGVAAHVQVHAERRQHVLERRYR